MNKLNWNKLQENILNTNVIVLDSCTSTNILLKESSYTTDTLLITNEQTNGIGRINREFISNKDKGIYMSLLTFKKIPLDYVTRITAITSVVVSRVIEKYISEKVYIKWVNDIYLKNKKICGILVQSKIENNELKKLIIGIGINLYCQTFKNELSLKASSIEDLINIRVDRNQMIIDIINDLNTALENYDNLDFMEEYKSKSNLINKDVTILLDQKEVLVKVVDINLNGELVVLYNNKIFTLNSTEVIKVYF